MLLMPRLELMEVCSSKHVAEQAPDEMRTYDIAPCVVRQYHICGISCAGFAAITRLSMTLGDARDSPGSQVTTGRGVSIVDVLCRARVESCCRVALAIAPAGQETLQTRPC
jgi:hypothetical protein